MHKRPQAASWRSAFSRLGPCFPGRYVPKTSYVGEGWFPTNLATSEPFQKSRPSPRSLGALICRPDVQSRSTGIPIRELSHHVIIVATRCDKFSSRHYVAIGPGTRNWIKKKSSKLHRAKNKCPCFYPAERVLSVRFRTPGRHHGRHPKLPVLIRSGLRFNWGPVVLCDFSKLRFWKSSYIF